MSLVGEQRNVCICVACRGVKDVCMCVACRGAKECMHPGGIQRL